MLKRPAFYLDTQICTGCKTCIIACKDKHDLPAGVRWRRVVEFTGGDWDCLPDGTFNQNVFAYYISVSCNHCQDPVCVKACPSKAMHQDDHGIVTVDPEKCVGCRYCEWVCPYSAPQFDKKLGRMTKCDFCREDLQQGTPPACVAGCPTRALQFGEYDQLVAEHGSDPPMIPMPPTALTEPSFVLETHRDAQLEHARKGTIGNPEEVKDA
ncbi:MAG: dimethylsulfoxide reductase subunit B [Deltaproteobacteria bacterium]|nr:dimethylsulfoxide reductase subunit B [Deltaproteobacteria bacterium]